MLSFQQNFRFGIPRTQKVILKMYGVVVIPLMSLYLGGIKANMRYQTDDVKMFTKLVF